MVEIQLPPRPRTGGTPHSLPSTPASGNRRKRQAVGFTNRSRPSTAVSASRPADEHSQDAREQERPTTSSGHNDRLRTSDSSQRPPRYDSMRAPQSVPRNDLFTRDTGYSGFRTTTFGSRSTMARPGTGDKPLQRRVREKILKHRVNLGPVLRQHSQNDGFITPDGLRHALEGVPQLELNVEEMDFCTAAEEGPEGKVNVRNFLDSLKVPDYDQYDPWGQSRFREQIYLGDRVSKIPPRTFTRSSFEVPEKQTVLPKKVIDDKGENEGESGSPSKPKRKPGAGIARKYLRQISDEMQVKGLNLLDVFRKVQIYLLYRE